MNASWTASPPTTRASARAEPTAGYREYLVDHAPRLAIDLEVVRRTPGTKGFTVLPRRWVVERTLGAGSSTTAAWPATTKPCLQ
ncbi:hypothetical protein JHY03_68950 (plasmid) [Streptomyces sp. CA-256286]|nr:hypothetical protein JHY03_68950 [Streptomyces sp. CA-256286]